MKRLERALLLAATTLISINIWTGAPLAALWVGSRVVGQRELSMAAVFVVVATLAALLFGMTFALVRLSARYDELVGRPQGERRTVPWLRSMRAEDAAEVSRRRGTTAVEVIVVASTVTAVVALEVWFFFFAGSPLGG
ncbi:MAG TPA: hypothetical protein VH025_05275 [Solirubrobacteraceae bacterium]|jgi:hypothetical protein|nr:hypothetical protein [Solirubrobacteraceae bacterium]